MTKPAPPRKDPPDYATRLAAMRVLIGAFCAVYLAVQFRVYGNFSSMPPARFEPVGLARWLEAPLPPLVAGSLTGLCITLALLFCCGLWFRIVGPTFAILLLWVASYRSSFGMMFHSDNLLCLHALLVGFGPAVGPNLGGPNLRGPTGPERHGDPLTCRIVLLSIGAVTAATYVLAGVAKLKLSGGSWVHGDILRNYIAYDCLRKIQLGSIHSPLGAWLVQYAAPFPAIGLATLLVELGAPLGLLGRRWTTGWTASILAFHWGVLAVMAIAFVYPLSAIPYLALLPAERLFQIKPIARLFNHVGTSKA